MLLFLFLFGLALGAVAPSGEVNYTEALLQFNDTEALLQGNCPDSWTSFNNHCYKYVSNRITWVDAELHCKSQGANLVAIHSLKEHFLVRALIKNSDITQGLTWIGLSDIHKEGTWLWSDGSATNFLNWSRGEPNNYGGKEECVQTNFLKEKKWNDVPCSRTYASVCVSRTVCA